MLYGDQNPEFVYPTILRSPFFLKYNPRSIVPLRYLRIILTPFQYHLVGVEMNLASRLTAHAISGPVPSARYINAPIALR
jgi:hypothetical protein